MTALTKRVKMACLMLTRLLKAKLHHAVVTRTNPEYHGSITIDSDLLKASGLLPYEAVLIADCENGNRFETYIIAGLAGSKAIEINGAAAGLSKVGNRVIVMPLPSTRATKWKIMRRPSWC